MAQEIILSDLVKRIKDLKLGLNLGLGLFDDGDKDCIEAHINSAEYYIKIGDLKRAANYVSVAEVAERESTSSDYYLIVCNIHGITPILQNED